MTAEGTSPFPLGPSSIIPPGGKLFNLPDCDLQNFWKNTMAALIWYVSLYSLIIIQLLC